MNHSIANTLNLTVAVTAALFGSVAPGDAADKTPKIVFILADNLAYGEVGAFSGGASR